MTGLVPGDPASCSRLGGELRRRAALVLDTCEHGEQPVTQLRDTWSGRGSVTVRRRLDDTLARARAAAADLDRAGRVLQEHAADLAEVQQRLRAVEHDVAALGCRVVDGRVCPPSPRPAGSTEDEQALAEAVLRLQDRLDGVLRRSRRTHAALARALGLLPQH